MKIAVIGQGYVGLTVAIFASRKNQVIGYDLNASLVNQLNSTAKMNLLPRLKKFLLTKCKPR